MFRHLCLTFFLGQQLSHNLPLPCTHKKKLKKTRRKEIRFFKKKQQKEKEL